MGKMFKYCKRKCKAMGKWQENHMYYIFQASLTSCVKNIDMNGYNI